jgi:single-stranded DNA-specific DHH superfamily exonuclease
MFQGVEDVKTILNKLTPESRVLVYYDPDIDGLASGFLVDRMFNQIGIKTKNYINENRSHHFELSDDYVKEFDLIICVDFSLTNLRFMEVVNLGVDLIVIDHHETELENLLTHKTNNSHGVLINNQYHFEDNDLKFLSGAGVVYFTLKDVGVPLDKTDMALVGLSLLSDIRPLENKIAKVFLDALYSSENLPLFKYYISVTRPVKLYGVGYPSFDRNYVDFTFSPKINALLRANRVGEAIAIFKGERWDLAQSPSYLENVKKDQSEFVTKVCAKLTERKLPFKNFDIYMLALDDKSVDSNLPLLNYTGLFATHFVNQGKSSAVIVVDSFKTNKIIRGSFRGVCDNLNYLKVFQEAGFDCAGHAPAFGIKGVWTDNETVDFAYIDDLLNSEKDFIDTLYDGRVIEVANLGMCLRDSAHKIGKFNNYVRTNFKKFIKYTGDFDRVTKKVLSDRFVIFNVEGVEVKGFDSTLELDSCLILPTLSKNMYLDLYAHPVLKIER